MSFYWLNDSGTLGFEIVTPGFEIVTLGFDLVTRVTRILLNVSFILLFGRKVLERYFCFIVREWK